MTIGQLASACQVPGSTIRFYERIGLIRPAGRTAANYRFYGPESRRRLAFIRAAQDAGFDLEDIRSLLAFGEGRRAPCDEVRRLVEGRLGSVRERLRRLHHVEGVLLDLRGRCERRPAGAPCPAFQRLGVKSTPQRKLRGRRSA